tara:strand:+ start:799 stop:2301 length:1503 start_codon:yes stop_codon:yes gene_type:complete
MKKIFAVIVGLGIMASCNRNASTDFQGSTLSSVEGGLQHFDASQLERDFTPMMESTNLSGKTGSQLNYTFRGYANPVEIGGVDLAASAVFQVDDMIFVAWHTNDYGAIGPHGTGTVKGSLSAYRLSGIGQYELKDRVDFEQHDLYGLSAYRNSQTGNIEVMVTGQRNTDNSQYTLAGHKGAIVARIDYDYINDEFWEGSLMELPLIGVAGTGIVALGAQYFVTTGDGRGGSNGAGGVFQVDRSLRNVVAYDAGITDAIDIEVDPRTVSASGGEFYVLDRNAALAPLTNIFIKKYQYFGATLNNLGIISSNGDHRFDGVSWHRDLNNDIAPVSYSKGHLVIAQGKLGAGFPNGVQKLDSMLINYGVPNGGNGYIHKARGGQNNTGATPSSPSIMDRAIQMGNFSAISFDPALGVLYCGGGDNGAGQTRLKVIAMGEYAADKAFVNTHDLVGELTLPSSVFTVGGGTINLSDKNINDITIYQTRHIAISLGDDGLMFIQKNH